MESRYKFLAAKLTSAALARQLLLLGALTALSTSATAQSTQLQPLPGPDIIESTIDMQANFQGPCILQDDGELFCWSQLVFANGDPQPFRVDFMALNDALNNDIAQFSLATYGDHACAIGRQSGVACVDNPQHEFEATELTDIPEPDATYIALSKLDLSENICGIQADNRTVCWGASEAIKNIPPRAQYLKQVDLSFNYACGVDLTDALVCWGETIIESAQDQQFGNEDLSTLGAIKQVALGPYGACVIKSDDSVRCFGGVSRFTEGMAGQRVQSIDAGNIGGPTLCFTDLEGKQDCKADNYFTDTKTSFSSALAEGYEPRLVSAIGQVFQINQDNSFIQYYANDSQDLVAHLFPTAPTGLTLDVYSDSALELIWDRPSGNSDFASGYEIYRGEQLIDVVGVVTSYFDSGLDDAASQRYSVRPIRGFIGGTAATPDTDGPPMNPKIAAPTNLNGSVYSSTALEIFYDRGAVPGTTYEITRNGAVILAASEGNSFFDSGLTPDTDYTYGVSARVNGNKSAASNIDMHTRSNTANSPIVATPEFTRGVRYSSSALELFWVRPPSSGNVVLYELSRNGEVIIETDGVSFFDNTAFNSEAWDYSLVAIDSSGNRSASERMLIGPVLP